MEDLGKIFVTSVTTSREREKAPCPGRNGAPALNIARTQEEVKEGVKQSFCLWCRLSCLSMLARGRWLLRSSSMRCQHYAPKH